MLPRSVLHAEGSLQNGQGAPVTASRRILALVLPELVRQVPEEQIFSQLLELAEVLRGHALQVSFVLPDTLWLDVTGMGHLHAPSERTSTVLGEAELALEGERELALSLKDLVEEQGHRVQLALASGPRIAQAMARYGSLDGHGVRIVAPHKTAEAMAELPLLALLDLKKQVWFAQLGVLTVSDLLALPERSLASRLGKEAAALLELARGHDPLPLQPCSFPRELEQRLSWDEPSVGLEPLLFALRGMTSRFEARLCGRGEALSQISLELEHERTLCRSRGIAPTTTLEFEFASPLYRSFDLQRVLRSRLERTQLPAPYLALTLRGSGLCPQTADQLELGSRAASAHLEQLPVLLAELEADVGPGNLGVLSERDAHCPEDRSRLRPLSEVMGGAHRPAVGRPGTGRPAAGRLPAARHRRAVSCLPPPSDPLDRATRLLRLPVAIPVPLRVGEGFALGGSYYTIERLHFAERLDLIKWWTNQSESRDYLWAWLMSSHGGTEALIYVDRRSGRAFVQALSD